MESNEEALILGCVGVIGFVGIIIFACISTCISTCNKQDENTCKKHSFGKWEQYTGNYQSSIDPSFQYTETRQKRVCEKCNYMQIEVVNKN